MSTTPAKGEISPPEEDTASSARAGSATSRAMVTTTEEENLLTLSARAVAATAGLLTATALGATRLARL